MTGKPFVTGHEPAQRPKRAFCPYCALSYPVGARHSCAPKPIMSWVPIAVGLGWLLAATLVVLLGALAGGFISWNPFQ